MNKKFSVFPYFFVVFAFFATAIGAQELNPSEISARVLQGETFEFSFSTPGAELVSIENIGSGTSNVVSAPGSENIEYIFSYATDPNFEGRSSFVVQQDEYINHASKQYSFITVDVVESLLFANDDHVVSDGNITIVDVLANDVDGFGTSTLTNLELISNGQAVISNGKVEFTPDAGFTGTTSFNYTIEDANGYINTGTVSVFVLDGVSLNGSLLDYVITSGSDQVIYLDRDDYILDGSSVVGGTLTSISNNVVKFSSNVSYAGLTSFDFIGGDGSVVSIEIDVVDNTIANDFVIDDAFFTSVGTPLTLDVLQNDLRTDGVLIDYSAELSLNVDGSFDYIPSAGFSGVKNFTYTMFDGLKNLTGNIEIYVGNYLPQLSEYTLSTKENTPLVIEYDAPINDFDWSVKNGPSDGDLSVNVGSAESSSVGCDIVSGFKMVVYRPDVGFVGVDEFTIEYCVDNGACKEVDVVVEVLSSDEECPCFGSDCVWAGDTDNNGRVNVADLLAIGFAYGESGEARTQASTEWCANKIEDWAFDILSTGGNTKYADGNGDGVISVADTSAIADNHSSHHNISSQEVLAEKGDILTPVPDANTITPGETLNVEFFLGSEEQPVLDRQGIAFSLQLPEGTYDPNSVRFIPNTEWFGEGSPVLTMSFAGDGAIEVGMVRSRGFNNRGISGFGSIGVLKITGVGDHDGFRPGDEELPVEITSTEAIVSNGIGKKFNVSMAPLKLMYKVAASDDNQLPASVTVYPNPSINELSFYADNNDEIIELSVYDITGSMMMSKSDINENSVKISHTLPEGMYVASIKTNRGLVTEKLHVIKY